MSYSLSQEDIDRILESLSEPDEDFHKELDAIDLAFKKAMDVCSSKTPRKPHALAWGGIGQLVH